MGVTSWTGPKTRKELLTVLLSGEVECVRSQPALVPSQLKLMLKLMSNSLQLAKELVKACLMMAFASIIGYAKEGLNDKRCDKPINKLI